MTSISSAPLNLYIYNMCTYDEKEREGDRGGKEREGERVGGRKEGRVGERENEKDKMGSVMNRNLKPERLHPAFHTEAVLISTFPYLRNNMI